MTDDTRAIRRIAFLSRSPTRVRVLERLLRDGECRRRDLRETLDASRSTVSRTLSTLEDRDWVARTEAGYRLTPAGAVVAEGYLELDHGRRVRAPFREQIETGRHGAYVVDGDVPFYLGLGGEGTAHVGVEDDEGFPRDATRPTADDF